MKTISLWIFGACLLIAACGSSTADGDTDAGGEPGDAAPGPDPLADLVAGGARPTIDPSEVDAPPPVRIVAENVLLDLDPWTTCWSNYCADGAPSNQLDLVSDIDQLFVEFPVEGWSFSASSRAVGVDCGREQTEPLEPLSETVHRLEPLGPAGTYDVNVFGRGPGGDVIVSFRWETTVDGVMPVPEASISLLADRDGRVDSYGIEFPVLNLASTPSAASATVVVTSADGASHEIKMVPDAQGCTFGDGGLFLTAPIAEGLKAAALGKPPFTYEITLLLDGDEYKATAVWPDDVDEECRPCVPLSFQPDLPALGA